MDENWESVTWDAIVIGTGMGGGTVGYELARLGRRVLFLEKGSAEFDPDRLAILGQFPEQTFDLKQIDDDEHTRRLGRGGRMTEWVGDLTPGTKKPLFRPVLGEGTGGSSALYGMVTERFFEQDFTPRRQFQDVAESTVPEEWPIRYQDLLPYYRQAEQLYRVRGTADPLRPQDGADCLLEAPPMTSGNAEVTEFLRDRNLHPYRLHVACEFKPECRSCQAYLCGAGCKNHSGNICVEPAVRDLGATLIDQCEVQRLEATRTRVTRVLCRQAGVERAFEGRVVILGAGAMITPTLLLNSKSTDWPTGLANDHDQVGRNFMRHFVDIFLMGIRGKEPVAGQVKEISANDFYLCEGDKFGTLQSIGHVPPFEFIMNGDRKTRSAMGFIKPFLQPRWKRWFQDRWVGLAAIMEDLPYADNRIVPGPGSQGGTGPYVQLSYRIHENDAKRHKTFGQIIKKRLGKYPGSWVSPLHFPVAQENSALGHQCGTCRFGHDAKTSVLDRDNRAWGLDNLFVVDTSMLPSSGGINPSLTIAANALRVASRIDEQLG